MAFCKEYNAQTAKMAGQIIPVEITVYEVRQAGAVLGGSVCLQEGLSSFGRALRGPNIGRRCGFMLTICLCHLLFVLCRTAASPSS